MGRGIADDTARARLVALPPSGEAAPGDRPLAADTPPASALKRRSAVRARVTPDDTESPLIVAESAVMRRLLALAERVARAEVPVLLQGETGTGKEVLARLLRAQSTRAQGPFLPVNCAAIPGTLVESTLFGHVRGAFTGADRSQPGVFEAAEGGIVFLDEVGELSPGAQGALLRVLESSRIVRVGARRETEVDVRVVAASHRDLADMVAAGTFRRDLFYRINAVTLQLPPLRDRTDDVLPLLQHFMAWARGAHGSRLREVDDGALPLLHAYPWPGNIRELRNVVEHAAIVHDGSSLGADDLPPMLLPAPVARSAQSPRRPGESFRECVDRIEASIIVDALAETEGNQAEAARRLRMPRRTLVHKLRTLGLRDR